MITCRMRSRAAVVVGLLAVLVAVPATAALAHPLGNFSVNHYNGLTLRPDGIDLLTIIDTAEIPTQQALPSIDTDGDDTMSIDELAAQADLQCAAVGQDIALLLGNDAVPLRLASATLETVPGAAGLPTLRLTCPQSATGIDLSRPAVITLIDDYRPDRVGWHEITAVGDGVQLIDAPVGAETISDELRVYPQDLLSSPLNQRSVTLRTEPGSGGSTQSFDPGSGSSDPFTRLVAAGDRALQDLVGDRELTPVIGALAVLLAVLLGSGHALLPGHGKTVMAAYLAGRRGSRRDAWLVGATVTVTHTASVLVLGMLISLSAAVIGEQVLRLLGILSGLLIAGVGLALLLGALRSRRRTASLHAHDHEHEHEHDHVHDHTHEHEHAHAMASSAPSADAHTHDEPHRHGWLAGHQHGPGGHTQDVPTRASAQGRLGIVGMGLAGGLVPSPSALVVLLGAVALGQTVFGVLLVLAYGFGMAATLTAVGLLLVRFRDRIDRFGSGTRLGGRAAAVGRALPVITASLVLVVGIGLVVRGVLLVV